MEEFVAVLRAVSMLYSRVHVSDLYYMYLKKIAERSLTSQNVCCESAISHLMKAVALNCSQCNVFFWYATVAWKAVGADESSVWHTSPLLSIKWLIIGNDLWPLFKASLKLSSIKVSAVCTNLLSNGSHENHEGDEGDEGHPVCTFYVP